MHLLPLLLCFQCILQILVVILEIFSHDCELREMPFISCFFPFEQSFGQRLFVKIDEAKLHTFHVVLVVLDGVSPDLQRPEHYVLVLLHEVPEHLCLIFLVRQLDQLISLSLQFLPYWYLIFKLLPGGFKLVIDVAVSDRIKDSLQQHLSSCSFNLLYQQFLLGKVLLVSRVFAPALPCLELDYFVVSLSIHNLEFHGQEHLLLEPHIGDELTHMLISLLKSLSLCVRQPHDKGLSSVCLLLSLHDSEHEILLGFFPQANISPVTNIPTKSSCFFAF